LKLASSRSDISAMSSCFTGLMFSSVIVSNDFYSFEDLAAATRAVATFSLPIARM